MESNNGTPLGTFTGRIPYRNPFSPNPTKAKDKLMRTTLLVVLVSIDQPRLLCRED